MKRKVLLEIPGEMYAGQECEPARNIEIYHKPEDLEYPFWASYKGTRGDVGRWSTFTEMLSWIRTEIIRSMDLK